jgi:eukaryotic-like serine/threonine-protein kinase
MRADLERLKREAESGHVTAMPPGSGTAAPAAWKKRWAVFAPVGMALMAALIAAGLYSRSHRRIPLTDKDTAVIADFANSTGDGVFDDTLKNRAHYRIEAIPFSGRVGRKQGRRNLKADDAFPSSRLTPT